MSIDSRGIIQILFGNSSVTPFQSLCELYHNSVDAGATELRIFNVNGWMVICDNGKGMSLDKLNQYLVLLNTENNGVMVRNGKYGFGGKQAIMRLANLTGDKPSECAYIVSRSTEIVSCKFDIANLLINGWTGNVIATKLFDCDKFNQFLPTRTGTTIAISPNAVIANIFGNTEINDKLATYFYRSLKNCAVSIDNVKIEPCDPLCYNISENKAHEKIVHTFDGENRDIFVFGDKEYLPIRNRLGYVSNMPKKLNEFEVHNEIDISLSSPYREASKHHKIYLCRNDIIIGEYVIPKTSNNNVRAVISVRTNDKLHGDIDRLFGVNMNKGIISFDNMPKTLQKTICLIINRFCGRVPRVKLIMEKTVQRKLKSLEGGDTEVNVNGKFIDLLTSTEIIEIKRYNDRLDALKIIYYAKHYPNHRKRIHLFQQNGTECPIDLIFEKTCEEDDIRLTYE